MAVKSMTGFGRAAGQDGDAAWSWEIRTVNNKGLDVRLRLPQGMEALEVRLRETLAQRIKRGSCAISLTLKTGEAAVDFQLNQALLLRLSELTEKARALTGHGEPVPLAALMTMKGVIEAVDMPSPADTSSPLHDSLLRSFEAALDEVLAARRAEGERLQAILAAKLAEIEKFTQQAEASPDRSPEAIRSRLRMQIQRLLSENAGFDEDRLYQEAVLIATKADIEEELQRLYAHVAAARELIEAEEPAGRRLEFLAQEFQREANTLCSKSNAAEITRIGLRLKSAIDQFREQVQNVE